MSRDRGRLVADVSLHVLGVWEGGSERLPASREIVPGASSGLVATLAEVERTVEPVGGPWLRVERSEGGGHESPAAPPGN